MTNCSLSNPPDRDISKLEPGFRARVEMWLAETPQIAVHEALRNEARQACLVRTGKSWVNRSMHQDGLAVDVHFKTAPHFPASSDPLWAPVRATAEKYGIVSGFTLWGTDGNHFQLMENPPPLLENPPEKVTKSDIITQQIKRNSQLWHMVRQMESTCVTIRAHLHQQNETWRAHQKAESSQ